MIETRSNNPRTYVDPATLADLAAEAADDKKARAIAIIDLQEVSTMADYFVLANGATPLQVRAIAQNIEDRFAAAGHPAHSVEGMREATWVLLDFGTVIVHVMLEKEREYYNLERLWSAGRMRPWQAVSAD